MKRLGFKSLAVLCLIFSGIAVNIGSIGSGGDGGDQDIKGVWEYNVLTLCSGYTQDYENIYLEITDDRFREYQCYGEDCYYCSGSDDAIILGGIDTSNISVKGDTMTITVGSDCKYKMALFRASVSDIEGAEDNCSMISQEL